MDSSKLRDALTQWRDSLVNLSYRNRLLNYRPTRASTLEFTGPDIDTIYRLVGTSGGVYAVGTKPPARVVERLETEDGRAEAFRAELDQALDEFDYAAAGDSLFVDKTQREVTRILKRLAADARREWVDKGLSVLYIAFGSLHWTDEGDDPRVSPLVLVPVSLVTDGPRKPHRVTLSEDELAVNPALALKLAEYGLALPLLADVEAAFQNGDVTAAMQLFVSITWPEGWTVEESVVLANFMFAKEAMYRDLVENEELVLQSQLLAALAGALPAGEAPYAFDAATDEEVDVVAPPEETPLVLNADASQRAAVFAASAGKSFVLDGPPGTGKSQTIANVIASLIRDGKTVLFVSEKVVALEVVRERLSERGLGAFLLELHSSKAIRAEVARSLGKALDFVPVVPAELDPRTPVEARSLRESLTNHVAAMNDVRAPLGRSLHSVMGELASLGPGRVQPAPVLSFADIDSAFENLVTLNADRLGAVWDQVRNRRTNLWRGLEVEDGLPFDIQASESALLDLRDALTLHADLTEKFASTALTTTPRIASLLEAWAINGNDIERQWLTDVDLDAAISRLHALEVHLNERDAFVESAISEVGVDWPAFPIVDPPHLDSLPDWIPTFAEIDDERLVAIEESLDIRQRQIDKIRRLGGSLAQTVGAAAPHLIADTTALVRATETLLAEPRPLPDWLGLDVGAAPVKDDLARLQAAWDSDRKAEAQAAPFFTSAVLTMPIDELASRILSARSPFAKLRAEYRADIARVRAVYIGDPKKLRDNLPAAAEWYRRHTAVENTAAQAAALLGSRFVGATTDWDSQLDSASRLETFVSALGSPDARRLQQLLGDGAGQSAVLDVVHELSSALDGWAEVKSVELRVPSEVSLGSLDAIAGWIASIRAETTALRTYFSTFSPHLGASDTVAKIHEKVAAARAASGAIDDLTAAATELIDLDAEFAASPTKDRVERATSKVASARAIRAAANPEAPAARLTGAQFDALSAAPQSIPLRALFTKWESTSALLLAHFADVRRMELEREFDEPGTAATLLADMRQDPEGPSIWLRGTAARQQLEQLGFAPILDNATTLPGGELASSVRESLLRFWVGQVLATDNRLHDGFGSNLDEIVTRFREIDSQLIDGATASVIDAVVRRRPRAAFGQASVIRREAEKKKRHIAVRELVSQARDVIQAIHPCFMMSPLAVSQYLPPDVRFDYVIFDEASQVMPGDAINCIYRADALITAGDQKQLPPTNFFAASASVDEESDEEDLAADYESVLDLMKSTGQFPNLTLRWHYRSRHEHLIAYSNASFYGSGLKTFPGALDDSPDLGVKYLRVEDGLYRRGTSQDNPIEAARVADRVIHHFDTRAGKSLGVVAFSAAQRDAIDLALELAKEQRPDLLRYFDDALPEPFFVKNLEYVQGDERDVMIFSTGYGPDESGKVHRNFGAVNRQGGERRLNVAITRAKELVEVVTSMKAGDIGEGASEGVRHLRRYLDFAQRGPTALAIDTDESDAGTDSPFEDAVIAAIQSWGYTVRPQVGVAGYRIDIGVHHPSQPGAFMLGVECDGAMYHSSRTARDRDRLRHEILEGLGWRIHHIWGTAWYRHTEREMARLRKALDDLAQRPVTGRAPESAAAPRPDPIEIAFEPVVPTELPEWAQPYTAASVSGTIPRWVDPSDVSHVGMLTPFVEKVLAVEGPMHYDTLAARLREATGVQRVGNRIQGNLLLAAQRAGIDRRGPFLYRQDGTSAGVRSPSDSVKRMIEHVDDRELSEALQRALGDAAGASEADLIAEVCRIYGWQRKTAQMTKRLSDLVENLVKAGLVLRSENGLSIR